MLCPLSYQGRTSTRIYGMTIGVANDEPCGSPGFEPGINRSAATRAVLAMEPGAGFEPATSALPWRRTSKCAS